MTRKDELIVNLRELSAEKGRTKEMLEMQINVLKEVGGQNPTNAIVEKIVTLKEQMLNVEPYISAMEDAIEATKVVFGKQIEVD